MPGIRVATPEEVQLAANLKAKAKAAATPNALGLPAPPSTLPVASVAVAATEWTFVGADYVPKETEVWALVTDEVAIKKLDELHARENMERGARGKQVLLPRLSPLTPFTIVRTIE